MARESRRRITMRKKRHTPEEIVSKLRQVDVLVAQGTPVAEAIRAIGVTEVSGDRKLATARQFCPPSCVSGLPTSGSGGVRARPRGLAGCASPTGCADQAPRSTQTNHALTFTPDHPAGADQVEVSALRFSADPCLLTRQEPNELRCAPLGLLWATHGS